MTWSQIRINSHFCCLKQNHVLKQKHQTGYSCLCHSPPPCFDAPSLVPLVRNPSPCSSLSTMYSLWWRNTSMLMFIKPLTLFWTFHLLSNSLQRPVISTLAEIKSMFLILALPTHNKSKIDSSRETSDRPHINVIYDNEGITNQWGSEELLVTVLS